MINNPIGVLALSKREILRFLSVASQTIFPPIVSSVLFMLIFGVAIGSRVDFFPETGLSYLGYIIPGLMTMHVISSSYENTTSSLFIARWHNHIQDVLLSPLSYFEMVLGLLAGGVVRALIVASSVFLVSLFFEPRTIMHPWMLLFFLMTIAVSFSCAGMIGALWAEDFGMLNIWNVYLLLPLILLGGVFHPVSLLPKMVQVFSQINPMYYLVQGIRYSITGVSSTPVIVCAGVSLVLAFFFFYLTVYLFKIGYKLRT